MATHSSVLAWRIPVDRGAWQATVHGVSKRLTRLSDTHTHISGRHGSLYFTLLVRTPVQRSANPWGIPDGAGGLL